MRWSSAVVRRRLGAVVVLSVWPMLLLSSCGGDDTTGPDGQATTPTLVQEFSGNNQQATAGTTLPVPFVVEVLNRGGQPVGGATVTFAVATGGGSVSPVTAVTNTSGQARTTYTLGTAAGAQAVTATVGELPPITFTATALAGAATQIMVAADAVPTSAAGMLLPAPVVLRVADAQGNGVAGVALAAAPAEGSGAFAFNAAATNAAGEVSGVWRLGTVPGPQRVVVSAPAHGTVVPATLTATAVPGPPDTIAVAAGNSQTGDTGEQLATPLVVRVVDAFGNAVPDYDVTFAVRSGGGSVTPAAAKTDASGQASAAWTLGAQTGAQGATAAVSRAGWTASAQFDALAVAPSPATLWTLDQRVVDAEYDARTNVIITVSANPSRLTVIDPEARTQQPVDLAQVPLSVAINPAGTHAAVSHDGWLSYVNLATRTVVRVYPVQSTGGDVVLGANGYAYVFPRSDQWVDIRCIDLATGLETQSPYPGPYAGALAKLHPSGDYIYSASNGLSPSDFEKYDIRTGTANVMYDSPYHGDYEFSGNLWISGDGTRMFARSGNVFRSSAVRAEDMTYAGRLPGVLGVQAAVHPASGPRIYVLGTTSAPDNYWAPDPLPAVDVRAFEPQFLAYQGSVPLPKFRAPVAGGGTTGYQAEGRFLFENAAATRLYAVVRAPSASGIALDWGIAAYDVTDLP